MSYIPCDGSVVNDLNFRIRRWEFESKWRHVFQTDVNRLMNGNGGSRNMAPKTRKVKSLSPKPANIQIYDEKFRET